MTNLEKLLNGIVVGYFPLGEVTTYEQPTAYLVKSTNYNDKFQTPVLTAGKTFILGYTDETTGIYKASINPVIIFDDFTTANKWVDFDFKAKSSAMKMITSQDDTKVLLRYIYHWLNTLPSEHIEGDHKRQWISNFSNKMIPIPCPDNQEKSLEIQLAIVETLDKFTKLEAELEAELDCRKRQYNYYRNKLLNSEPSNNVSLIPLGELGTFTRGSGLQKKDFTSTGVGCIHYGQIYTYYGTYTYNTKSFVSHEFAKKTRKAKCGDLIIATTSENDEDVCKSVAWLGNQEIAVSSDACFYTHTLDPKYVAYYFQTELFQTQKKKYITGTKVRRVNPKDLAKMLIPIPYPNDRDKSIIEQQRIVSILDKFDKLTTSISEGLPAEIELRRKQYEYYRNKLLSFPNAQITQ